MPKSIAARAAKNFRVGSRPGAMSKRYAGDSPEKVIARGIRRRAAAAGKKLSGGTVRRRAARQAKAIGDY